MNPIDYLIIAIIALIVGLIVFYLIRAKKKGVKCIGCPDGATCSGKCSSCPGGCGKCTQSALTDEEKIDLAADAVLRRFLPAFEELAK